MDYVYTIEGSGTQSLARQLNTSRIHHCGDPFPEVKSASDKVWTTMRDPYLIGATWASRIARPLDQHPRYDIRDMWFKQWQNWADNIDKTIIVPVENLLEHDNIGTDSLNLKDACKRGDMVYFYHFVPKYFIEFAQMCMRVARG